MRAQRTSGCAGQGRRAARRIDPSGGNLRFRAAGHRSLERAYQPGRQLGQTLPRHYPQAGAQLCADGRHFIVVSDPGVSYLQEPGKYVPLPALGCPTSIAAAVLLGRAACGSRSEQQQGGSATEQTRRRLPLPSFGLAAATSTDPAQRPDENDLPVTSRCGGHLQQLIRRDEQCVSPPGIPPVMRSKGLMTLVSGAGTSAE